MSNPATLLADLLDGWRVTQGQSIQSTRPDHDLNSVAFWRLHGQAVRWLQEIERFISGLDAMGTEAQMYTGSFPAWYKAMVQPEHPWQQPMPSGLPVADPRDIALLRALGAHMETAGYASPIGQAEQLSEAVAEAEDLVRASSVINDDTRRYLLGLIREARDTLAAVDSQGSVAVRSVMFELGGAMMSIAGTLPIDEKEREGWRTVTRKIFARLVWMTVPYMLDAGADAIGILPS